MFIIVYLPFHIRTYGLTTVLGRQYGAKLAILNEET